MSTDKYQHYLGRWVKWYLAGGDGEGSGLCIDIKTVKKQMWSLANDCFDPNDNVIPYNGVIPLAEYKGIVVYLEENDFGDITPLVYIPDTDEISEETFEEIQLLDTPPCGEELLEKGRRRSCEHIASDYVNSFYEQFDIDDENCPAYETLTDIAGLDDEVYEAALNIFRDKNDEETVNDLISFRQLSLREA